MRIAGITIPDEKRIDIALTYLYGVGRSNVRGILTQADIKPEIRTKDLSEDEVKRITKVLEGIKVEGDLRGDLLANIKRLRENGSYRGTRHTRGLPVHGQRTRSNARTKRGKRLTIGAVKKDLLVKMEAAAKSKGK